MITQYLTYTSFLLHYCPRTLIVLYVLAHLAFWGSLFAYPAMALDNFDGWWLGVKVTFGACLVAHFVCSVVAVAAKWRSD